MFIAALFPEAMLWKQTRRPVADEWIKKMWNLYKMELYSSIVKNEILLFAEKWIKLKNINLSEIRQILKAKNHMFSLICGI
jgi:hypothetical protein